MAPATGSAGPRSPPMTSRAIRMSDRAMARSSLRGNSTMITPRSVARSGATFLCGWRLNVRMLNSRGGQMKELGQFQRYLIEEFVEDWREGHMSRRDMVRRTAYVTGGVPSAATVLVAMGCG